jgi:hypothetical protein
MSKLPTIPEYTPMQKMYLDALSEYQQEDFYINLMKRAENVLRNSPTNKLSAIKHIGTIQTAEHYINHAIKMSNYFPGENPTVDEHIEDIKATQKKLQEQIAANIIIHNKGGKRKTRRSKKSKRSKSRRN